MSFNKNKKRENRKILELGSSYPKNNIGKIVTEKALWDEKFYLLKEYINSSEEIKENFTKNGRIKPKTIIEKNNVKICISLWLNNQKKNLMKKYQNMTIEQIENSGIISEYDKYKMKKLLELGVTYPKLRAQQIGKASMDAKIEDCDNASKIFEDAGKKQRIFE